MVEIKIRGWESLVGEELEREHGREFTKSSQEESEGEREERGDRGTIERWTRGKREVEGQLKMES